MSHFQRSQSHRHYLPATIPLCGSLNLIGPGRSRSRSVTKAAITVWRQTTLGSCTLSLSGPTVWKNLHCEQRLIVSHRIFYSHLKAYPFLLVFYWFSQWLFNASFISSGTWPGICFQGDKTGGLGDGSLAAGSRGRALVGPEGKAPRSWRYC